MYKQITRLILMFFTSTIIFSCQNDEQKELPVSVNRDTSELQQIENFNETEKDYIKQIFAKSLAKTVESKEIRRFLKKEINKEFDGDFNILFNSVKHKEVDGMKFSEHLIKNLPPLKENSNQRLTESFNFEAIQQYLYNLDIEVKQLPLLQIAMPFVANEWDSENLIPAAVFTTEENLRTDKSVDFKGYLYNGSTKKFNNLEYPDEPVLVISENERITVFDKEESSANERSVYRCPIALYSTDENYEYYHTDVLINDCGGTGGGGTGDPTPDPDPDPDPEENCDREGNFSSLDREQLRNIEFLSMSKLRSMEGWLAGKIELRANVIHYYKNPNEPETMVALIYEKRDQFRGCSWFNCWTRVFDPKRNIFPWNPEDNGDRMKIRWYEDNVSSVDAKVSTGFKVKPEIFDISVGELSFDVELNIKGKNKLMGDNYIYYCDDFSRRYDNGFIEFYVITE